MGAVTPERCLAGFKVSANQGMCELCATGTYQDQELQASCKPCEAGYSCARGAAQQTPCAKGSFTDASVAIKAACTPCPAGQYQSAIRATGCLACLAGSYCPEGAAAPLMCAAGSYSSATNLKSAAECSVCPKGSFCPTGATAPSACGLATAAPSESMSLCTTCTEGTYEDTLGSSACKACPSGFFCPAGSASPIPATCDAGTYVLGTFTSREACVPCPSGYACAGGASQPFICLRGNVAPNNGTAQCAKCAAGKFQSAEGMTTCEECPRGSFCQEGSANPQPCPGGTWLNVTGATSSAACQPVQAGFWAALGSSLPQRCPISGFRCPGAAADTVNTPGGSLPIELTSGSSATLTEVEVVQQQLTLDISINEYNETAVKLELAALYGVPAALIDLAATAGSLQLSVTIRTLPSSSDPGASVPTETTPALSLDAIMAKIAAVGTDDVAQSISRAIGTNVSVAVASPSRATVSQEIAFVVGPGKWTTAGKVLDCPVGTYNPLYGQTFATACLPCPDHSTTRNHSSSSITQCLCETGFEASFLADGNMICLCAAGFEIINGMRCEPCPMSTFKPSKGNTKCLDCPVVGTTTAQTGTAAEALCVCRPNTFASARDALGRVLNCSTCRSTHAVPTLDMTDCTAPGTTLENLTLLPGFWRQSEKSFMVRACELSGNASCVGGTNASRQCALGYRGPLCSLCDAGYYGGRGEACKPCEGDAALTVAGVVGGVLIVVLLGSLLVARLRRHVAAAADRGGLDASSIIDTFGELVSDGSVEGILSRVTEAGGTGAAGSGEKDSKHGDTTPDPTMRTKRRVGRVANRVQRMKENGTRLVSIYRLMSSFGVKLRILVSFGQVISQLDVVFALQYPDVYKAMLRVLSQFNLSLDLLPTSCVLPWASGFAFELFFKTLTPLLMTALLLMASHLLRRGTRTRHDDTHEKKPRLRDFLADVCSDLWFVIIFLTYPSTCATIFKFFSHNVFAGAGEEELRVLRADASIVVGTPLHTLMSIYAVPMIVLFPIGVPLLYAVLLFRSRHTLRELRRIELDRSAAYSVAKREAAAIIAQLKRKGDSSDLKYNAIAPAPAEADCEASRLQERCIAIMAKADDAYAAATTKYEALSGRLPTTLRKLTAGYEMRCYWFECFECVRKILIVGVPVFLPLGSPGQLVIGLLMCFITFGIYSAYAPYVDASDDNLSSVCQLSIFFSLLASIVTSVYPNDPIMEVLLPVLLIVPVVLAILTDGDNPLLGMLLRSCSFVGSADGTGSDAKSVGLVGHLIRRLRRRVLLVRDAATRQADRLFGVVELQGHPVGGVDPAPGLLASGGSVSKVDNAPAPASDAPVHEATPTRMTGAAARVEEPSSEKSENKHLADELDTDHVLDM